jgi:5-formyltetrahydrofolate cyclo-ligase
MGPGSKDILRRAVREELKRLRPEQRALASEQACEQLHKQELWQQASSVLCFAPLKDEIDTLPLIRLALSERKVVALPQYDRNSLGYRACRIEAVDRLVTGAFGVREPAWSGPNLLLNQLDLILVPGVAFDLSGRRLGRGKGFYDRLLARIQGTKCGVAFEEQIQARIPVEPHDVLLDCLVTPERWLDFRQPRFRR